MKKFILYTLLLFWWCLLFPNSCYVNENIDSDVSASKYSFKINNKEIKLKFLDFFESEN